MNAALHARRLGWLLCCLAMPAGAAAASHAAHVVVIDAMRFTPQVVQARPGDSITWENHDLVAHNVTANAAGVRSGDLAPGQSWRYTVPAGGSFEYACSLHPVMTGRVELEAAGPRDHTGPRDPPAKVK